MHQEYRRVRVQPRMSASLLGKYLAAGAHGRESILRDAKFPPRFKATYYRYAEEVVRRALLGGEHTAEILDAGENRIRGMSAQ